MSGADAAYAAQQAQAITQIANVSRLLRDAIQASIPVAPEQYMTVCVPGVSIDTRDITDGGTYVYGKEYSAFVPPAVRQAEARLVDGMMPLANVMIGNTGKSVSRSYDRALDTLVPRKATIKTGRNALRSPGDQSYDNAMLYLTTPDKNTGRTPVEIYIQKQAAWAASQADWDKAKLKAENTAKSKYSTDLVKQRQDYDEWNQSNYRKYKFAVQGRYMDWVANGHKYEVEQNFGIVDVDSIMERIELSKESLRNSMIVDSDGANELAGVILEPRDWATKCQKKAQGWYERNRDWSLDQIDAEIARLQRLKTSYTVLKTQIAAGTYPVTGPAPPDPTKENNDKALSDAFTAIYKAEADMNKAYANVRAKQTPAERDAERASSTFTGAVSALNTARRTLQLAIDSDTKSKADYVKYNVAQLDEAGKASMSTYLDGLISGIDGQITLLETNREKKAVQIGAGLPAIAGATAEDDDHGTIVAVKGSEKADPVFLKDPTEADTPVATGDATTTTTAAGDSSSDPWTEISVSFSAEDQNSTTTTSSWGMSVGGGAGWGLWSAGGSYAHDQSKSDTVSDMAKCDVSVTFSALVVNVNRPWLYGELFADDELDVADGFKLSPGAQELHRLMNAQKGTGTDPNSANQGVVNTLAQFSSFPAYPTSFVIATDTVVEFRGNTQHIESHFSAHSNAGSVSVGWGPFSVSSSFHESASSSKFQMQSTATGCRLSFGAPQIIGWVSQIVPALPRNPNFVAMVQNLVV